MIVTLPGLSRSFELRAATSLARLWLRQGKKEESHGMLAMIALIFITIGKRCIALTLVSYSSTKRS
jgi:hypothetical protein